MVTERLLRCERTAEKIKQDKIYIDSLFWKFQPMAPQSSCFGAVLRQKGMRGRDGRKLSSQRAKVGEGPGISLIPPTSPHSNDLAS